MASSCEVTLWVSWWVWDPQAFTVWPWLAWNPLCRPSWWNSTPPLCLPSAGFHPHLCGTDTPKAATHGLQSELQDSQGYTEQHCFRKKIKGGGGRKKEKEGEEEKKEEEREVVGDRERESGGGRGGGRGGGGERERRERGKGENVSLRWGYRQASCTNLLWIVVISDWWGGPSSLGVAPPPALTSFCDGYGCRSVVK